MQSILPNLPFIIQLSEGAGFVDADGDPYTPDPLPRVIVRQFAADGSYSELVSLVDDEIAEEADLDGGPLTGGFRYEGTAEQAAENTTLKLGFVTTDAALVALGKFFSERWVTVAVVGAAEVDTAAIAAAVWNRLTSTLTTPGSVGAFLLDKLNRIGAGVVFVRTSIDPAGNVTLYRGKKHVLQWHSSTTLNLTAPDRSVRFQYRALSYTTTVTGSAGSWTMEAEVTVAKGALLGPADGELSIYDAAVELAPPLAEFTVTVEANRGAG